MLKTERLYLRKPLLSDAAFLLELLNSEGFIQNIGQRNVFSLEASADYLDNRIMPPFEAGSWGLAIMELQSTKEAIGLCGLVKRPYLNAQDVGFALLPSYMRQGFAHEALQATIRYAFEVLKEEKLLAIVLPNNKDSIRLLEKNRFEQKNQFSEPTTHEILQLWELAPL